MPHSGWVHAPASIVRPSIGCIARPHHAGKNIRGVDMLKFKTIALAAAAAVALTVAQPKPAEAGDAGKIIAGIALGAITAGILSHHARSAPKPYVHHYAPPPAYYPTYRPHYYGYGGYGYGYGYKSHSHKHKGHGKKKHVSRWLRAHPSAARAWGYNY